MSRRTTFNAAQALRISEEVIAEMTLVEETARTLCALCPVHDLPMVWDHFRDKEGTLYAMVKFHGTTKYFSTNKKSSTNIDKPTFLKARKEIRNA